jgi:hypothetical protein
LQPLLLLLLLLLLLQLVLLTLHLLLPHLSVECCHPASLRKALKGSTAQASCTHT